jgi:hypothetical protein
MALLAAAASAAATAGILQYFLEGLGQGMVTLPPSVVALFFGGHLAICLLSAVTIGAPIWLYAGRSNAPGPRTATLLGAAVGVAAAVLLSWLVAVTLSDRGQLPAEALGVFKDRAIEGLAGGGVGGFIAYWLSGESTKRRPSQLDAS